MRKLILLVTMLSVGLSSVPAMAENPTPFHAMSQLPMQAEGGIQELDADELAQVEGGIFPVALLVPTAIGLLAVAAFSLAVSGEAFP
jgi:lactobin A/cerein 7B family class IIb bacteriocin